MTGGQPFLSRSGHPETKQVYESRSFAEPVPSGQVTRSHESRSLAALGMTKRGEGLRMTG